MKKDKCLECPNLATCIRYGAVMGVGNPPEDCVINRRPIFLDICTRCHLFCGCEKDGVFRECHDCDKTDCPVSRICTDMDAVYKLSCTVCDECTL